MTRRQSLAFAATSGTFVALSVKTFGVSLAAGFHAAPLGLWHLAFLAAGLAAGVMR